MALIDKLLGKLIRKGQLTVVMPDSIRVLGGVAEARRSGSGAGVLDRLVGWTRRLLRVLQGLEESSLLLRRSRTRSM